MRHLQTYRLFESIRSLSGKQMKFLDEYTKGVWTFNPTTGEVDIDGDFDCSVSRLQSFGGIKFGEISGSFKCTRNSITSLEGCPHTVGVDFECSVNPITSLEGGPKTVGGTFTCQNSPSLTSVSGAPETVGRSFLCLLNSVKSLEGLPENMSVGTGFNCSYNYLTSLVGVPKIIGGDFVCIKNDLANLEGAPQTVGGEFSSDGLKIPEGEWSMDTLIKIFLDGTPQQKHLVAPLVDPKVIQQQIDENPEGMLVKLKGVLNHPHFRELKWPERLEQEKDLLSDLGGVGL
jgi:hypothetical protein